MKGGRSLAAEILVCGVTLTLIAVLIIWLIMQPRRRVLRITVPLCIVSFAVIFIFYLLALMVPDDPLYGIPATFAAFVETFVSFTNSVAYSDIADSDMMAGFVGTFWFETAFWALHMLVIFTLAISGFAVFGRKIMDRVRVALTERVGHRDVFYIFGDSQAALMLGRDLAGRGAEDVRKRPLVVLYSPVCTEELREEIAEFGGALIEMEGDAAATRAASLQEEHPGCVAVFDDEDHARVNGDLISDLLARKVIHDDPPYAAMGLAGGFPDEPFRAVIVGFGELGQACARCVVQNAQLSPTGTRPILHVLDEDGIVFQQFKIENPEVERYAEVRSHVANALSFAACDILREAADESGAALRVYVACAPVVALNGVEGKEHLERNREIAGHLKTILARMKRFSEDELERMVVTPCVACTEIWTSDIILHKALDARAIKLNAKYALDAGDREGPPDAVRAKEMQKWKEATEFNRDSSRASCDFIDTMAMMAGLDPACPETAERFAQALAADEGLLDDLARIEHLRWCAFHACNGYVPMPLSDLESRVERWQAMVGIPEKSRPKPPIDPVAKEHACMVDWEELPGLEGAYSAFDAKIRNGATTLQGRDADNVRQIPELLRVVS